MKMRFQSKLLLIGAGLTIIAAFLSHYPCLDNGFTNYDDNLLVTANPAVTRLSPAAAADIFTSFHSRLYHPLVTLSFAVEYRLFGLFPGAYHATNLLLHLLNCVLALRLFLLLSGSLTASFAAALLFAVHPALAEPVAWVSGRKDVLFAPFYLLSLIVYLSRLRAGGRIRYAGSLGFFILALLAKPMAASLPLVLFLLDRLKGRRLTRATVLEKLPFLATAALFAAVTVLGFAGDNYHERLSGFSPARQALTLCYNAAFSLGKLFAPLKLSACYPHPLHAGGPDAEVFAAAALCIASAALLFLFRRRAGTVLFGVLFFLITLLPVLPLTSVADRYLYIPALGIFFIAGKAFAFLCRGTLRSRTAARSLLITAAAGCIVVLGMLSRQRCLAWKDSLTLWNDVLSKYPGVALAYTNRGQARLVRGEPERALADFDRALALSPSDDKAWLNRGYIHLLAGDLDRALEDTARAAAIDPRDARIFNNLGAVYKLRGEYEYALRSLDRAIELEPAFAAAWYHRASVRRLRGETDRALEDFRQTVRLSPRDREAFLAMGDILSELRRDEEAAAAYSQAIAVDPRCSEAYQGRAAVLSRMGNEAQARADLERAREPADRR